MTRKSFYARYSLLILMAFFFAAPLLIQGAHRAIRSNTNKVADWLPKSFNETKELQWFRQHFVADQFVVVSWPGCTLGETAAQDDPRIERLAKFLAPKNAASGAPSDHTKYFQAVTTARRTLDELTSKPSEVPYEEAVKRLQGTLIGPDGRQTCVVIMLSDEAIRSFRLVVGRHVPNGPMPWQREPGILINALQQCRINPETARLGGPPVENVAIDEEGDRTLARLASLSGLFGLVLAWWSLRSIRLTLIVFFCGVLTSASGLAFVFWSGQTTDAVMMAMPSMLYVLAISGAVHMVNYYRDAVHEGGLEGAPERALGHGWKPALLANITTGIGLASLGTSDIEPIRKFGIYSAVGVFLMLIFLFGFLPAALHFWPIRAGKRKDDAYGHSDGQAGVGEGTIWFDEYWARFGGVIIRNHAAVALACFAFILIVGLGLTRVHTSIDLLKLFDEEVRVRQDYAWLEENVGRLVPLEVVVQFPPEKQRSAQENVDAVEAARKLSYLERLELISLTQQTIDRELGPSGRNLVGPSLSPVTFAPPIPPGRDTFSMGRRRVTDVKLEESEAALARSGYLRVDPTTGAELWRISLRAAAFADLDYGAFVSNVRAVIEPVLAGQRLREQVLALIAKRATDGSLSGASVCLWQRAKPHTPRESDARVDALAIFASATQELLSKARLKLTAAGHDLGKLTEAEREAAIEHFKSFDCVVVVGNISNADVRLLSEAGARVVDGRSELKPISEDIIAAHDSQPHEVSAVYTGVVPIVYKAQRALLENLIQSSFWSFVTITPLMMLVCRSILGGAVVMLPNALPVLVVFGGMGWLGIPVDIGSMMAASIALGVAVDDTIHYLTWYREGLNEFGERKAAIISAYRRCAPPTLQAAMISGLGLSVFALSTFTPTQRLGWLMMTILLAGVVAELVMLPAILAGPLGKVFDLRRPKAPAPVPKPHAPQRKSELISTRA